MGEFLLKNASLISSTSPVIRVLKINNVSEEREKVIMGRLVSVENATDNTFGMFRRITFLTGHKEHARTSHSTFGGREIIITEQYFSSLEFFLELL